MADTLAANPAIGRGTHEREFTAGSAQATGQDDQTFDPFLGAAEDSEEEGEDRPEEIHDVAVNLLYVLFAHLQGATFQTQRSGGIVRQGLPGPMGQRR